MLLFSHAFKFFVFLSTMFTKSLSAYQLHLDAGNFSHQALMYIQTLRIQRHFLCHKALTAIICKNSTTLKTYLLF